MRGLPDWGRPEDRDGVRLFAAHELDHILIALPEVLTVATDSDGRPAFRLTAIRPLVPMPGRKGHGRLDLELQLDSPAATEDGAIRAAPPLRAWLRFRAPMSDIPPSLLKPLELDCSGLGFARLTLPLAPEGVTMIEAALKEGATPIIAHVELEVAGLASRLPARAIVDMARLRAALIEGSMTPALLAEKISIDAGAIGVTVLDPPEGVSHQVIAEAVTDHIRGNLCGGPLAPAADAGLALVLSDSEIARGTATLDLSLPLLATRAVAISLDPFAVARELSSTAGGISALITRGQSGLLPTGRHEIIVDASVARPCIGPLALGATLTFPPRPPARAHAVVEDFELPVSGEGVSRQVRLAPGEQLDWMLTGFAFWPTSDRRGVERLDGAAITCTGARALLRPDAFPLTFVDVDTGPALLALANVEVELRGVRPNGSAAKAAATLTASMPRVALAVPADANATMLTGIVVARDGASRIELPVREAADWRIELSDLPGYGTRSTEFIVKLPANVPLVALEVIAEDAPPNTQPETYAFTPTTGTRTHRWFCHDPFRPGLCWRWRGQAEFSAPIVNKRVDLAAEALSA